ncbi:low-density lipoprotein receptor repeat domain-containing protein cueball [Colletes latitarsis]|uniref:low-density lipoprotein receptor repeat domain-containing protein cueball n=1 Tax=Colletes latitarsis TaxID=2605962 RepID=UPI0040369B4A
MTSREYVVVTLTIVLGILAINTDARSWDLAVVIGRDIEFFSRNQTLTGQARIADAISLTGLAYDDISHTMYFSDTRSNFSLFSNDLTNKNFTPRPLLKKQTRSHILGIVFDTRTRNLIWLDALKEVIMKMYVPLEGEPEEPILLHNLTGSSPRGIALDVCNSLIYWVNSNVTNPSIERSNLDGSDRITIIKENLYEPLAVAIDHAEEKLYWIDDVEGIHVKVERSNLDGTDRESVVRGKHQQPVALTVDRDTIYWIDLVYRAIWMAPKSRQSGNSLTIFKAYNMHQDADPIGIIARDNAGKIDCEALAKIRRKTNYANWTSVRTTTVESFNNLTTSTEDSELTTESSRHCLNDGKRDLNSNNCHCKSGFIGAHCETELCHNYCLRGSCSINSHGSPVCRCEDTFGGPRCETDLCKDYCLHDGKCFVQNGKPACKCKYSEGLRCEGLSNGTKACEIYCANIALVPGRVVNTINCRCPKTNETNAQMVLIRDNDEYKMLILILGVSTAVFVLTTIVLSYYVNKLRRRPRIRKRFVVSKGGVTPLTSRPQLPDNQCEITIENCCNMNICETPCFEPNLRTPVPEGKNNKKEEKNSLLDNMEGNSW